jgi:hypothetical protein
VWGCASLWLWMWLWSGADLVWCLKVETKLESIVVVMLMMMMIIIIIISGGTVDDLPFILLVYSFQ